MDKAIMELGSTNAHLSLVTDTTQMQGNLVVIKIVQSI